jgi:hypothetical protein
MAKFYTDKTPTPVFAVTFVSNREGIIPSNKDTINKDGTVTSNKTNPNTQVEDITNESYKFSSDIIKQGYLNKVNRIKTFKTTIVAQAKREKNQDYLSGTIYNGGLAVDDSTFFGYSLDSLRQELINYEKENAAGYLPANTNINSPSDPVSSEVNTTKDSEYLIYSNLQIQKTDDPNDLSQQSNWYLREAEVELTRDWPIQKAKLIVTCKLLDNGSIPPLVEVEKGFVWSRDKDKNFIKLLPEGRFLSADDEVRIYAGYKNDQCISMNDLDDYPFDFTNLEVTGNIPEKSEDGKQLTKLQEDKKAVQDLINKLNNGFTDPNIWQSFIPVVGPFLVSYNKLTDNSGRLSYNDNKGLLNALQVSLNVINNSIQIIQRKAGVKDKTYFADPNKIAPIFWGFIDSVDFISNSNAGVQIIYNLRDRSRILADTKLVTLPFLGTDANNKNTFEGLKHKTVESVYRATNGGIYLDNSYESASSLAWRGGFDKGEVISLYEDIDKKIIDTKSALANERLKYTAAIENPARWVIANAFLSSSDILNKTDYNNLDPLFHIWTLQPPLVSGSANNTMQIINKSPFEILNYLAMTEIMSIDIFTSHINGHFMFAPRILDTTGLYDEQRGNRLYYFFDCFDQLANQRNLIKDIRVQTSTVGVYNRFTVLTADFSNPTNASLSGLTSIVDIASANTKNRKVPIKQHVIVDPKIKASEGNKEGAAQALALTTASTMARDHTMIIFKIIGDSSFYPGEAVRIFNTVLHSKDIFTFNATSTSSAVFLKSLYDEVQKLLNSAVKQQGTNNKVVDLSAVIDDMRKVAGAPSDDLNDALPMYKVRAITHSLKANGSDAGYTTKIVAVADIL